MPTNATVKRVVIFKDSSGTMIKEMPVAEDNNLIPFVLPDIYMYQNKLYLYKQYFILAGVLYLNYEETNYNTISET
jgi:hypothetical protein